MRRAIITSLFTVSAIALATPAFAQDTLGDPQASEVPAKDIIVTGSRIPGRTVADSPVPIDVIGGDALTNAGSSETNKILRDLVPSFNFPQPSLTDGTDSVRPATLRGLAPDQALVLVNGKRRHTAALINLNGSVGRGSSAVDLNEIPPIAIDRVEVLRDGASSQYGSDAIAGVINIQLSRKVGVSGSVTFGKYDTTMSGVNDVLGVQTTGGVPVVLTPGANAQADVLALNYGKERERHDGDTLTLAARVGLPVGDGGYLVLTGQFRDRDPTNRSGADPRRQYFTVGDPRELTFNRFSHGYGDGKTVDYNVFLNGGIDLTPNLELYTFGSYGVRDGTGAGFYRRSNDARNRDFAASTTTFVPYYADGFLPKIYSQIEDVSGAVGVRGDVGGLNADLSVVYGSNQLDYQTIDSFNVSLGGLLSPKGSTPAGWRSARPRPTSTSARSSTLAGCRASASRSAPNIAMRTSRSVPVTRPAISAARSSPTARRRVRRCSPVSSPRMRSTARVTALPVMPKSTPISARPSRSRPPAATSISATSAAR